MKAANAGLASQTSRVSGLTPLGRMAISLVVAPTFALMTVRPSVRRSGCWMAARQLRALPNPPGATE
jgi:hypothetical protein